MKALELFSLARAEFTPGQLGDEQLRVVLIPKRATRQWAVNLTIALRELLKKEGADFRGRSVRITVEDLHVCRDCGCTEDAACEGGCSWVEPDLCSSCVTAVDVVWASALGDGHLVGDVHAWRDREPKSVCGRAVRPERLQRPRFSQRAASEVGCPSCIKALAKNRAAR